MKKRNLFTYISLVVCSLVILATLLMAGMIYLGLSAQLKREFSHRVKAEANAATKEIDNLSAMAQNRLRELSLDNTIRVTLMLGAKQQLKERLKQLAKTNPFMIFFVTDKEQKVLFQSGPGIFDKNKIKSLLAQAPQKKGFTKNPDQSYALVFSSAIRRNTEKLGMAACLFNLTPQIRKDHSQGLVAEKIKESFVNIYTGQKLNPELYAPPVNLSKNYSNLYYLAKLSDYQNTLFKLFLLVALAAGGVLLISILGSLIISHKLAAPLKDLSLSALTIAQGKTDQAIGHTFTGIEEVDRLSQSLETMLENMKKTEELTRYQELFEGVGDMVTIHNNSGQFLEVNQITAESLGYTREKLLSMNMRQIVPVYKDKEYRQKVQNMIQEKGKAVIEVNYITQSNEVKYTEAHMRRIVFLGQQGILSVGRDITKRIQLENQLRQAQKMEAIGTLAGGIAHDFNNILTSILGYTELALAGAINDPKLRKQLNQVLFAGKRAKAVVRQILTFSRQNDQEKKNVELKPIVKEALKLLRATLPSTIEIKTQIDTASSWVMADPTQIHQVLLNLCANASQAMEKKGGVLTVSLSSYEKKIGTGNSEAIILTDNKFAPFKDEILKPGKYVKLSVKDTGHGMSKELVNRIFEPYYTTKETKDGTGLGLAVVHGIVTGHDGYIEVETEPNNGCVFHIYLPSHPPQNNLIHKISKSDSPLPTGSENILLVDDEVAVAELEREILESLGYSVHAETQSQKALEVFHQNPHKFHLILTDQTMPGMTGIELAKKILEKNPNQPMILCTGYQENINQEKAKDLGFMGFVLKPILMREIAQSVRKVLDHSKNKTKQD